MGNLFKNRQIIRLDDVDSTNTYLSNYKEQLPQGSIVIANYQHVGRGQGTNKWESEKGKNLTFSYVLYPNTIKAVSQFYISKIIALSVADFLSLYVNKISIKWPNDIYYENKKIAGILIEHSITQDFIKQTIAGIGININQKEFTSAAINPVSLSQITGETYNLDAELDVLVDILEYRYSMLLENELETIDENYTDALYLSGQKAEFSSNGQPFTGTIAGVEPTGELIIIEETGVKRKFLHKEVEFKL